MSFEIYCIPRWKKKGQNWFLDTHIIDLQTKRFSQKEFPIAEIPRLPIGAEIRDDGTINRSSGNKTQIHIPNFISGKITSLDKLQEEIYPFEISSKLKQDTKVFLVEANNKPHVFFCYELFRTFLCMDNRLINYLFQYDVLESFIDHEMIENDNDNVHATLTLNEFFPKSFLRSNSLLKKYLLLIYDKNFRGFRTSVQAEINEGQSDFSFSKIGFTNLTLTCQVKQYKTFNLVYYIDSIDSTLDFPIDELTIINSGIRSENGSSHAKKSKSSVYPLKHATRHDTSTTESGNKSYQEEISVLPLNYKFNKSLKIERLKLDKVEVQKDTNSTSTLPLEVIENIKLSLLEQDKFGEANFLNLNRDRDVGSFDFSEIPNGLIHFSKAIKILAGTINKNFEYWISEFNCKSSFKLLEDHHRKALIVKFDFDMSIYFVEIDSSDDRFISTLILFDIKTKDHQKFIQLILDETGNSHGRWPEKEISIVSGYHTIRHPRKRESDEKLDLKDEENLLIERISYKFLSIFSV